MRKLHAVAGAVLVVLTLASSGAWTADEDAPHHRPVKEVANQRISVGDRGTLPLYVSADWSNPLPEITRAVLVLHGRLRNADVYFRSALTAQAAAGDAGKTTLMIVPQFLAEVDVDAYHLPADTLRWTLEGWEGGDPALAPTPRPVRSRRWTPSWPDWRIESCSEISRQVVVAGHSGGAQVVQRYAIAGKGEAALTRQGVGVRYVVANPSSYAYFNYERPELSIAASCPGYNDWKYGMEARPAYLADPSAAALEQAYVARRVIYLLGTLDTNPNHPALDKSCMAEAEGPYRYARGHAYAATMAARDAGTPSHSVWDVKGVGHDGDKMLTSSCGLKALFDLPGCE